MPFVVSCPACGRKLQVPEACAGTSVRCPACETTFDAPQATSADVGPAGRKEETEAISLQTRKEAENKPLPSPGPVLRSVAAGPWEQVHRGLGLILLGMIFEVPGFVVVLMRMFSRLGDLDIHLLPFEEVLAGSCCLMGVSRLVAALCTILGLVACCKFPEEGMGKAYALGALVLVAMLVFPRVVTTPLYFPWVWGLHFMSWVWVSRGIFLGGMVAEGLLVLFVREVGKALRDRRTLFRFRLFVVFFLTVIALFLSRSALEVWLLSSGSLISGGMNTYEFLVPYALLQLACLALFVQQAFLLLAARRAVRNHLRAAGAGVTGPDDEDAP